MIPAPETMAPKEGVELSATIPEAAATIVVSEAVSSEAEVLGHDDDVVPMAEPGITIL